MLGRLALNTWFSCLGSLDSGITGVHHEACLGCVLLRVARVPCPSASPAPVPSNPVSSLSEATGAIDFVADPAALATILSGEGVKSCPLGRQSSLAQRVLVRGSKGGTTRRGQVMRRM